MKKYLLYILPFIFLLGNCTPDKNFTTIEYSKLQDFNINIDSEYNVSMLQYIDFYTNKTDSILFFSTGNKYIFSYDLATKKTKLIFTSKIQSSLTFKISDSIIYIFDFDLPNSKYFSYNILQDSLFYVPNILSDTTSYLTIYFSKETFVNNSIYFIKEYYNNTDKEIFQYNFQNKESKNIKIPQTALLNSDNSAWMPFLSNYKSYIILSIRTSNNLYVYNAIEAKFLSSQIAKTLLLDSVSCNNFNAKLNSYYYNVIPDTFNNFLYREVFIRDEKLNLIENWVILDSNFSKIGETIIPENCYNPIIIDKNRVIFYNKSKSSLNNFVLSEYKMNFVKTSSKKWLANNKIKLFKKSCKIDANNTVSTPDSTSTLDYVKNIIQDTSFIAIILQIDFGCPNCNNFALQFYTINSDFFQKHNTYLIINSTDKTSIKNWLPQNYNSNFVLIDTSYKYITGRTKLNPTLIIVKDKRQTFLKTYQPEEIDSLPVNIFSEFNL